MREEARRPGYVAPMPRTWWLRTGPFRRFAARELTSLFVLAFIIVLLLFLLALSRGRDSYESFLGWLDSAGAMALFAAILTAGLYHTFTWLRLSAHVQVVRLGPRVAPRSAVAASMVVVWLAISGAVAYVHIWL